MRRLSRQTRHPTRPNDDELLIRPPSRNVSENEEQSTNTAPSLSPAAAAAEPCAPGDNVPVIIGHQARGVRGGNDFHDDLRYFSNPYTNLTDTMKLIVMLEAAEKFAQSISEASIFLQLADKEVNKVCDLQTEETERDIESLYHTQQYNDYILSIPANVTGNKLTQAQRRNITELEEQSHRHMRDSTPSGYLVHQEDISTAERFLLARCPNIPIRQSIINGLTDYLAEDYSTKLIGTVLHDDYVLP